METKLYVVKLLAEGETQYWTMDSILEEINADRSEEWTDYDESDWEEGWDEWVAGDDIYSKPVLLENSVSLLVTYGCGSNLENCYSRVVGATAQEVRAEIARVTQGNYSFTYPDDANGKIMIETYNLKEVELQPMYPRDENY